jgi:TetR/AcrR family transcriptional repressor of nem operon
VAGRPREFDRDQVLVKAMELFWRKGYEATSLSDLTAGLGIGRQSLYLAFGDKAGLFQECLELYTDLLERDLNQQLDQEGSILGNLRRTLDQAETHAQGKQFHGCLLGNALAEVGARDDTLDRILRRKVERVRTVYERALSHAARRGELKPNTDVTALAHALVAFTQGAALLCRVWREPGTISATLNGVRALLDAHDARRSSP